MATQASIWITSCKIMIHIFWSVHVRWAVRWLKCWTLLSQGPSTMWEGITGLPPRWRCKKLWPVYFTFQSSKRGLDPCCATHSLGQVLMDVIVCPSILASLELTHISADSMALVIDLTTFGSSESHMSADRPFLLLSCFAPHLRQRAPIPMVNFLIKLFLPHHLQQFGVLYICRQAFLITVLFHSPPSVASSVNFLIKLFLPHHLRRFGVLYVCRQAFLITVLFHSPPSAASSNTCS